MKRMIKRDGHMHTPFCPHGTKDKLQDYVKEAVRLGREEITFTEHFPLPQGVTSEEMTRECALLEEEIPAYLEAVRQIKECWKDKIKINVGFEVDYIEGYEDQIKEALNRYGCQIEDAILSVHFVKCGEEYLAVDGMEDMEELIRRLGSTEAVYDLYYNTVLKSIEADLGIYKPRRIGHPSLVRTFNKKYPVHYNDKGIYEKLVTQMLTSGCEVDFNVSGLRKEYCQETYPSGKLLEMIKLKGVKRVGGSDSHKASQQQILSGFEEV